MKIMPICGIYKVTNLINGKIYIGQTQDYERRKKNHIYCAFNIDSKEYNIYFHNAIRKYGENSFLWEIQEECKKELLSEKEKYWISYYQSNNREKGYNLTSGGEDGIRENCRKVEQYSLSGDFIKEWTSAFSAAIALDINVQSIRQNLYGGSKSAGNFQWKFSDDNKIIQQYSKNIYYEGLEKGRHRKKCLQYNLQNEFLREFNSLAEARDWLKINGYPKASSGNIGRACSGNSMTAYGFIWRFGGD